MKKVNILVADSGWILERYALELKKRLPYVEINQDTAKPFTLTYFINYGIYKEVNSEYKAALFTHIEENIPELKNKFFNTAKDVDICISLSKKYAKTIKTVNKNVFVIPHGLDLEIYKPKLVLGFVGRFYDYTDRKGKKLLDEISNLDFVKIEYATGEIKNEDLPEKFYKNIDYTIITSKFEGGPMCLIESLALGKEVIAPKDIGMVSEFRHGIHHYKNSDFNSLVKLLKYLYKKKLKLSNQVLSLTWNNFAILHDKIFSKYLL